jgi:hypothetical protein
MATRRIQYETNPSTNRALRAAGRSKMRCFVLAMTLRLSRGGARTQINLSDLIFSYLRRELQRKARELKSSTIDVANGTNSNGRVVRSARSSIRAIATAPPTAPATKPTISLERVAEEGNCTIVYVGGNAPLYSRLHPKETGGRSESAPPARRGWDLSLLQAVQRHVEGEFRHNR